MTKGQTILKQNSLLHFKFGFTLAEVLITLGIIGIVAALTIPTLIANYQKTQYVTGLKKAYAEANEALKLMASDNGCPDDLKCVPVFSNTDWPNSNIELGKELKKYIKITKDCGITYDENDENSKCMPDSVNLNYDDSSDYGGGRRNMNQQNFSGSYKFITADGFSMSFNNGVCANMASQGAVIGTNTYEVCGYAFIDVNNFKGPNILGRDIFYFAIANGRGPVLYPYGGIELAFSDNSWRDPATGDPQYCYSGRTLGFNCAGRIMEEGWQMKY